MKKRIIISANSAWNLFNFRLNLIEALIKAGYEVIAVAPKDKFVPKLLMLGCKYITIPMDIRSINPFKDLLLLLHYIKIFSSNKPDIYMSFTIKPNIYGSIAAHLLNIPVVNNISGLGRIFIKNGWLVVLVKFLYRIALSKSAFIFFQNEEDRRVFTHYKLVKLSSTHVLPGSGVDIDYFSQATFPSLKNSFIFILIARMLWEKGVGEFVEAAKIIKSSYPNAQFYLLGDIELHSSSGVKLGQVKKWEKEGIIKYIKRTDDVRKYILQAHCVVLPSYREGLSRSLLEAASMGRPIITTNVPGCREVVDVGINGYVCRVKDSNDLAKKMYKIMGLSRSKLKKMAGNSRKKAISQFDVNLVIHNYLKIINSQINQKNLNLI